MQPGADMTRPSALIQVRTVDAPLSRKARMANRVIRWIFQATKADLSDLYGLVRLRRNVALFDRVSGALGIGRSERFRWHRATIGGVRVRVMRPHHPAPSETHDESPVLLYLHGGAFLIRTLNGHMNLAAGIARLGGLAQAVLPIYRLAPEYPYPAAIDDCLATYRGLLQRGIAAHRIVVAGDSAGGGLVLKLLMRLREAGLPQPACGVLISPFTDLSCSGDSIAANAGVDPMFGGLPSMHASFYVGAMNPRDPRCSPIFGDFCDLPPLLAQVGSTERLLDDSLRLLPLVRRAGGTLQLEVWKDLPHVWHVMGLPESLRAIASIGRFVRIQLRQAALATAFRRAA